MRRGLNTCRENADVHHCSEHPREPRQQCLTNVDKTGLFNIDDAHSSVICYTRTNDVFHL